MNLEQALTATEETMVSAVGSEVPVLQDASQHIILAGGKRLRPRMMFLAYYAAGGQNLDEAIPVAAALELVHTATLVHDDINDHGLTRRGRVTINEYWGRTFALLTGDFMFAKVYQLMAPYGDLNVEFSDMTVKVVEGETLQAVAVKDDTLDRETYQRVVDLKTASLFSGATRMGAKLAGTDDATIEALADYGYYIGLAFQVVDDILDLIGDPDVVGKTLGIDVQQGKGVAMAYGSNGSNGSGGGTAVAEAEELDEAEQAASNIKRRLMEGNAVEEGRQMAQLLGQKALDSIKGLPDNDYTRELRDLVAVVLERNR